MFICFKMKIYWIYVIRFFSRIILEGTSDTQEHSNST
jgi:hypothetical protein